MSNKPFDLEKALAGEPLQCKRTKHKFYFLGDTSKFGSELYYPIVLYNKTLDETTNVAKEHFNDEYYTMWQEPRPRVQLDLPAPLKSLEGLNEVYCPILDEDSIGRVFSRVLIFGKNIFQDIRVQGQLDHGNLFPTKEDAQEWLDTMRNARR